MSKKNIFIKLSWIIIIIVLIFLYFLFYVFPSIERINSQKRQLKDMYDKIEDLKEIQKEFPFPDTQENALFKEADATFRKHIPVVRNKEDFNSLLTRISNAINNKARSYGITTMRMSDNRKQVDMPGQTDIRLYLTFSGPIKRVVNFINHLSWGDYYVVPESITANAGGNSIYYSVILNVYTADGKGKINGMQNWDIMIDYQSPMLLKKVYESPMEAYTRRELYPKYGAGIFE